MTDDAAMNGIYAMVCVVGFIGVILYVSWGRKGPPNSPG